jgi:hypothetical protein
MKFRASLATGGIPNRVLIYRANEYSFDVTPSASDAFASALLDDLNLELDVNGKVVSIWGMCPHTRWKEAALSPPSAIFGEVYFVPDTPLVRGVSTRLNNDKKYRPVLVDLAAGWVCVQGEGAAASSVKILPGVIIEITAQGDLCALWLKPDSFPELAYRASPVAKRR